RLSAVARPRAHGALLGPEYRHAARRAGAPDGGQGQGAAPGARAGGAPALSRAPGGRRAAVRSNTRAGRRRPTSAPRADAGDRAPLEPPVRERVLAPRAA